MNTATFSLATMAPAIPEIVLLGLIAVVLIVDLFIDDENRAATYWLTIASLVGTAALAMGTYGHASTVTFSGMFVSDLLSQMLKVMTLLAVAATPVLSRATLAAFGLVFVVAGIAFKVGAAPFHMWIPDVYHGAATPATLIIGAAPKLAAFAFIMRLLANGLQGLVTDWQMMLVVLAIASMAVGNIIAIAQANLKRMLAYSTIAHMGFLVLGILAGTDNGYSSALFYVVAYVLMTLGSFGMILFLSRAGFEAESIDDFKGLNKRSPWYAFVMMALMFSLSGLPPTVGFFAKLSVLQAALDAGFTWLVVLAVLLSVVGAFYYLRIVKVMYMDAPAGEITLDARADARWVLSATGIAVAVLGVPPAPLMDLCVRAIP